MSLELEREEAVQALCAHYAQDHLSTGELETRFDRVYKSSSRAQLQTVLDGLPALRMSAGVGAPMYQVATGTSVLPSNEKRFIAIFSEVKKEGAWEPAPFIRAKTVFGSMTFDFRDATLPPGGIDMQIDSTFGEVNVLLPPGVGADVECSAVMGSVEDKAQRALPGAPMVRVRGGVLFGAIKVITKLPKAARLESWRQQVRAFLGDGSSGGDR